ncbi:hypothetical protein WJX74_000023 [Apatococcus lobatus]|uniref:Large ribosomal subunit protein bL12 C-terminal domain-containing protein n=1 Tax=Apatococcus lobatus TaxID=904363 RepID=A0AAW1QUR7_9CHLO
MRRSGLLLARWCNVLLSEQGSHSCKQLEAQCRAFYACTQSSSSGPDTSAASSWQPSVRYQHGVQHQQQQQAPHLLASCSASPCPQHRQYASGPGQEDSLIEDEPEVRELGSPRVKRIVDEIVNLNLLEVADLVEILRVRLGLGPDTFGMQMQPMGAAQPAAAAAAAAPEAAAPAAEKTEFNVKLDGYDAAAKIKVIKEVRAITGLGLKEAKEMVEKAPVMLKESLKKEEADELKTKLEAVGAKIVLE